MLLLKNISKQFGTETVLKNINAGFNGGLNFIIGPSGSGKSTLLKIISGMDSDFGGELLFKGKAVNSFSKKELESYYFNSVGFIWQNFQLIDYLSVEDNINMVLNLLPMSRDEKEKRITSVLRKLGIENLLKSSVSKLSGGQKQRVAIARALVKEPEMIIADEPTGALDAKSSKLIMNELKKISKDRLVIVVTHDKSMIDHSSNCYQLKNGTLEKLDEGKNPHNAAFKENIVKPLLKTKNAFIQAVKNIKGLKLKSSLSAAMIILSSFLMLLNFSGEIKNVQSEIYDALVAERGEGIRDIRLLTDSMGAGGSNDGRQLTQEVYQVFDKLKDDERIEFMYTREPLTNMNINIDGLVENYTPKNSRISPSIQKLLAGEMPNPNKKEVVIPHTLLDKFHLKAEDVIGKTMDISAFVQKRSLGKPAPVSLEDVTIVGVADTTFYNQVELEDCFIFSVSCTKDILEQSGVNMSKLDAIIRVKSLDDILGVVDDLQKMGYVPQGDFSMIENMLKLKETNESQGSLVSSILLVLSLIIVMSLTVINAYLRKSEYAILKINGYSNANVAKVTILEYLSIATVSALVLAILLPVLNIISSHTMKLTISGIDSVLMGMAIVFVQGVVIGIISTIIASTIKPVKNLKLGETQ